jgi:hypothetical protein
LWIWESKRCAAEERSGTASVVSMLSREFDFRSSAREGPGHRYRVPRRKNTRDTLFLSRAVFDSMRFTPEKLFLGG